MPLLMKRWKTIPALLAMFALLMPCSHAGHHHDDCVPGFLCDTAHSDCHACPETSCPKKSERIPSNSLMLVEPPTRQLLLIQTVQTDEPLFKASLLPEGNLVFLRTVQLLI